jgi:hypothetical protein
VLLPGTPAAEVADAMIKAGKILPRNPGESGFDDTEPARQRYACHDWDTHSAALTDTIFARQHQPYAGPGRSTQCVR